MAMFENDPKNIQPDMLNASREDILKQNVVKKIQISAPDDRRMKQVRGRLMRVKVIGSMQTGSALWLKAVLERQIFNKDRKDYKFDQTYQSSQLRMGCVFTDLDQIGCLKIIFDVVEENYLTRRDPPTAPFQPYDTIVMVYDPESVRDIQYLEQWWNNWLQMRGICQNLIWWSVKDEETTKNAEPAQRIKKLIEHNRKNATGMMKVGDGLVRQFTWSDHRHAEKTEQRDRDNHFFLLHYLLQCFRGMIISDFDSSTSTDTSSSADY
mmetsp:Transcript_9698/g.14610  ORF Transcript_9698/g.14610 Transcript_9698/m.14610 type:complete len:266 (+) Transcript_9698:89-886(+)|eukprot:CAMPEP_0201546408 /NCGR_PEP_ID=MMETSP0173_2-20130828/2686_1 /ASSEMBLY_ACC=CAM_ASM_000268 /TAXON_ID=218659 /ORGANISM="Vexillifera sp., Strain DIVA3 564/2" /LENGTH=265 /DNA_ID=CAMNT_0047955051 /DNA_START=36 /DNA_END=833 /DNA_ORIENTATION=-